MKIIEKNENQHVLEITKQYLESEGIPTRIEREQFMPRIYGPYLLVTEEEHYEAALSAIEHLDPEAIAEEENYTSDNEDIGTKSPDQASAPKKRYDAVLKWCARILILLFLIFIIYTIAK